ncbi:hypothetical protein ACLB2K_075125 [Fragaria x ananassa]
MGKGGCHLEMTNERTWLLRLLVSTPSRFNLSNSLNLAMRVADFIVKEPMSPVSDAGGVNLAKKYNLCPDMKFFATPLVLGSLANQVVHPAGLCFNF